MEKNIRQRLELSVVKFAYTKKDGKVRYATGTNNIPLLNELFSLSLNENDYDAQKRNGTTTYYDLGAMNWRCFRDDSLIEIIND